MAWAQVQDDAALADVDDTKHPFESGSASPYRRPRPSDASPPSAADAEPPLTTAELRDEVKDLEVRSTPLPLLTLGLTAIYPFQPIGLGGGFDVYALPRLRLSATASVGVTPIVAQKWAFSGYAEAGIGFVLLRSASETATEIKALRTREGRNFRSKRSAVEVAVVGPEDPPAGSFVRAVVPVFHSLELEGGAFTGFYPLHRCTADCSGRPTNEDASVQVTALYAGLRYVYFRWARSAQVPFVTRFGFEAAVDAITNPFWRDDPTLLNTDNHHPAHDPVGARVKLRLVGIKCGTNGGCLGLDLMGGYLPAPSDALASLGLSFE